MAQRLLSLRPITVLTLMAVVFGTVAATSGDIEVDMDGVLQLKGRHTTGHACPVDDLYALTAAHVIDIRWTDQTFSLFPYRYQNYKGFEGVAIPMAVYSSADLGWLRLSEKMGHYEIARHRPPDDSKVFWREYNLKNDDKAFQPEDREAKLLRVVAGHLILDKAPTPGASGGCVFNETGEVIGIMIAAWRIGYTSDANVGEAVAVFGKWRPDLPVAKKEENATE